MKKLQSLPSRWNALLILCFLFLIILPFVYESHSLMVLLTQVFIFAVFAMSYDILLGFTGIVSFGHAMFFGIGAYATAIFMKNFEPTIGMMLLSILVGAVLAAIVSYIVGMLSLRLKSHFYAMLTLAFAQLFFILAEQWRSLTMGNDGFTILLPTIFYDRTNLYLAALILMGVVYMLLRRFTQSPLGKVLQAIRENEKRVESLGYKVLHYKVIASIVAGVVASVSGAMYVYTLRYVNTSVFGIEQTLDVLLMTIIGGVGTLIGAVVGSGLIEFVHHWLTELSDVHWIFERWIILFGIIYILAVMFFPQGIVGSIQERLGRRKVNNRLPVEENSEVTEEESSKGA